MIWDKNTKIVSYVATMKCNMNCSYCTLIGDKRQNSVSSIDIDNFIMTLTKLNEKVGLIFQGGEIFLIPNFVELVDKLAEMGYEIIILSNLTHKNTKEIIRVQKKENVGISCSIHYKEYERTGAKHMFMNNYRYLRDNGFYNVWPKLLADPDMTVEDIAAFKQFYIVDLSLTTPLITEHLENVTNSYSDQQNSMFWKSLEEKNRSDTFVKVHRQKGNPCEAGKTCVMINEFGEIGPCTPLTITSKLEDKYKMGDLTTGFKFNENDLICPVDVCTCHVSTMWGP